MASPPNVLLVFPAFDPGSFWSLDATCKVSGRRRTEPPLGLITVAALLPADWQLRLIDRNTEEVSDADFDWADLVMTGGMIPQRHDTMQVIERCHARGKPVAIGGPDVTSSQEVYEHAEFRVVGEAESVMGAFAAAWISGARRGVFEPEKFKTDVTTSPVPRFDLVKRNHYLDMAVQFSRGCPFTCEFCDIIELYGRVPRTKTGEQMLAELEALYRLGHRGFVAFVDDNLIGNKKAVKDFLPHLCAWQKARGYPFVFSTQASINLSDDDALLQMMREANFFLVFIGIESPDTDTLISAQKKQNTRRELAASIHKIYRAGMVVHAGFIVGFDTEKGAVAEAMTDYIEASAIPICMVGMLTALPTTQLSRRLEREGRLLPERDFTFARGGGDACTGGLNFDTLRPRRDILNDYRIVIDRIYEPDAFFARVRTVSRILECRVRTSLPMVLLSIGTLARMIWWIWRREPTLGRPFLRTVFDCLIHKPRSINAVLTLMAIYLHVGPFARSVSGHLARQLAQIDSGGVVPRRYVPPTQASPSARPPAQAAVA